MKIIGLRKIILLIGCILFLHSLTVAAGDWFVRPAGGNYGNEDGSSYQDAWAGLQNVVWGAGGVQPGDNLYVCGLHLRTRTGGSAWDIFTPGANGTGEDSRIIIRGDYPGDPGIVWGAGIMSHEAWVDEGSNTWSITAVGTPNSMWYFEDITESSWTILKKVNSLVKCQTTPGSYYSPDYSAGSKFYVHCSDNGNPTNRIAANRLGYHVNMYDGNHYITWLNLKFYCIFRWMNYEITPSTYVSYIKWENCTSWYGEHTLFFVRNYHHHVEFINCDLAWAVNGIGFSEYPMDGTGPHHFVIRGCTIHDIGVIYGNSDSHAISGNGVNYGLIENNEIYNVGSGITWYEFSKNTSMKDVIIRWNYIHDTHGNFGANSRGIEFNCTGTNISDKSGNEVYGNLVANIGSVGYRVTWAEYEVTFYNNVAYNCNSSFYFYHTVQDIGQNVKLRNNISLFPRLRHIYFYTNTADGTYIIDSDYNIFYPVSGTDFYFKNGPITYTEWQANAKSGCTFDSHSIVADPLFVDPGNGDFNLRPESPAIDAGVDVGLTHDFDGNQVPQGNAPDIGAYEYSDPAPEPIEPEAPPVPTRTEMQCYNNVFNPSKGEEATISVELDKQEQVSVVIYDNRGKEIKKVMDEEKTPGFYTSKWNGKDNSGNTVGSGIYMVHIKAGGYTETKKIAVIK